MMIAHGTRPERQDPSVRSYIGGIPMLPDGQDLPVFEKTGRPMTFFFQFELPAGHPWAGKIVSIFAATDHTDDQSFLPKLPPDLRQARLTDGFFLNYQSFFRIFVFEATQARLASTYDERVAFHALNIVETPPDDAVLFGTIEPAPVWLLDDEAPRSLNGIDDAFAFLFQTRLDYELETVPDAPRQRVMDYRVGATGLKDRRAPEYVLFTSNELFFFGAKTDRDLVYIVPQS